MKRLLLVGLVVASLSIVACGGGGGGGTSAVPSSPTHPQSTGQLSFSIKIPVPTTQSGSKKPQYVGAGTQSLTFTGTNFTSPQVVNLTPSSPNCVLDNGFYNCTANASVPAGSQSLTVSTYDAINGGGNLLSTVTQTINVVANISNPLNFTLNGVAATVNFQLQPNFVVVNAGTQVVTAQLFADDADGNMIMGDGNTITPGGAQLGQAGEIPTMTCINGTAADCGDITIGSLGNQGTIQLTYNGDGPAGNVTIQVALTGYTTVTQTLTISPSGTATATPSPSPSPSPTASPTGTPAPTPSPTPTATPNNVIVNGTFETGDLTGWYVCRVAHPGLAAPINPNPAAEVGSPQPTYTQEPTVAIPSSPTATTPPGYAATPIPDPSPVQALVGATGYNTPHGGNYSVQVGRTTTGAGNAREAGLVGICQDVTVPATEPSLTLWVWEGGNVGYFGASDVEADLLVNPTWVTGTVSAGVTEDGKQTNTDPAATLFAETNCYNNNNTSGGTATSDFADCALGNSVLEPNTHGGVWRQKGPYDLTAYAGQTVTLMLGLWSSSNSTGYYDYFYADDVVLSSGTSGTVPITVNRTGVRH